jgi:hypothetical protein
LGRTSRYADISQADVVEFRQFRARMNTPAPFGNDWIQLTPTQYDTRIYCSETEIHRNHGIATHLNRRRIFNLLSQRGCDEQHDKCCRGEAMIAFGLFAFL